MRRLICLFCTTFWLLQAGFAAGAAGADAPIPKYGPAGAPFAAPLWQDHGYLQSPPGRAPDFWKLIPFYVGQNNGYACSVAALATVLNAIERTRPDLAASDTNFSQGKMVDEVKAARWKERVTAGWKGRHGLTLSELAEVAAEALKVYGLGDWTVATRSFAGTGTGDLTALHAILAANEASADDFVIIHFLQDKLTNDPGGPYPHISPIGAYDAASRRALVLDVDRDYYSPYWVGLERLLIAMAASTPAYGPGGALIIRKVSGAAAGK